MDGDKQKKSKKPQKNKKQLDTSPSSPALDRRASLSLPSDAPPQRSPASSPPPVPVAALPPRLQASLIRPSILSYARRHPLNTEHLGKVSGKRLRRYLDDVGAFAQGKGLADSVVEDCVNEAKTLVGASKSRGVHQESKSEKKKRDVEVSAKDAASTKSASTEARAESLTADDNGSKKTKKEKTRRPTTSEVVDANASAHGPSAVPPRPVSHVRDNVSETPAKAIAHARKPQKKRKREASGHGDAQEELDGQKASKATAVQEPAVDGTSAPDRALPSSQAPPSPSLKRKRALSVSNDAKTTNAEATIPKAPQAAIISAYTPNAFAGTSKRRSKRSRRLWGKHKKRKLGVVQDSPNIGSEGSNAPNLDLSPSIDVRGSFSSQGSKRKDTKSALSRDMKTDSSSEAALCEDEEESDVQKPCKRKRKIEEGTRVQEQQDETVDFLPRETPQPNHEDLHAHEAMEVDTSPAQSNPEEDSSAYEAEVEKSAVSEVEHEGVRPSKSIKLDTTPPQSDSKDVSASEAEEENKSDPSEPSLQGRSDSEEDSSTSETGGGKEEKIVVPEADHGEVTAYEATELEAAPPQSDPEDDSGSEADEQEKCTVPEPADEPDAKSEADSSEASEQESDADDEAPMRTAQTAALSPRRPGAIFGHAHPRNQHDQIMPLDPRLRRPYEPGSLLRKLAPPPRAAEPPVRKQPGKLKPDIFTRQDSDDSDSDSDSDSKSESDSVSEHSKPNPSRAPEVKPKQGATVLTTSYSPRSLLQNPRPPRLPAKSSVPKPPQKRKSALEKLKEGLGTDSEPNSEESDSSDEEFLSLFTGKKPTPKRIAPPPPPSLPARHFIQKPVDLSKPDTFSQKPESDSESESSESESKSEKSEPGFSRAVKGPFQPGATIEFKSPTSSSPSSASIRAEVESPHQLGHGKESPDPAQILLPESDGEFGEDDAISVDRRGSKDFTGSQRTAKSVPTNVNDPKPGIGNFICVRVYTKPKVSEKGEAARTAERDVDDDNQGEDSPRDTSTNHNDQGIEDRMSDAEDALEGDGRAPGDAKPAQSEFNGFGGKRNADRVNPSEVVTISSDASSSLLSSEDDDDDAEKDGEADNDTHQVNKSGDSLFGRSRRIDGLEALSKTDATRTTNGSRPFASSSVVIETASPTKTAKAGLLSQSFVSSGILKPTPNQETPRYRRGTSEDYPWIVTPQARREASEKLIEPSACKSKTATVLEPRNNIPQVDGSTTAHMPSTPLAAEAAERDNISEPGGRASSYENEPKGFVCPDGSLSARKRRTGLRSQHFCSSTGSQKPKRPPAGTVSCLPFPSVKASRFGLVQEKLAHRPFQLLVAVIFLNKTKGTHAIPKFREFIARYPGPDEVAHANLTDIKLLLRPLGLQNGRAQTLIDLAKQWLISPPRAGHRHRTMNYPVKGAQRDIKPFEILGDDDPRVAAFEIAHLPGCGAYALDSWRIFCRDSLRGVALDWNGAGVGDEGFEPEWKRVRPTDKELKAFLRWMWLREGWAWNPETGERELAGADAARSTAERWRWDQERGEEVWINGDDADEAGAAVDGGDVDMADADADALLSGSPQRGEAGRVVITKTTSSTAFQGAVEDDDEAESTFAADDEAEGKGVGDEDEAAADQLVQEANACPSQTESPGATRPPQPQSRPGTPAQQASSTSTQHAVVGEGDDGATTEAATDSGDAASHSDEHEDGATAADEDENSSYGGVYGVARLFRRAERGAKHFFRGFVEETPQPESPTTKGKRQMAAACDDEEEKEEEAMVDSSPIEYRDDDDDEMEGIEEHGDARQASPEL